MGYNNTAADLTGGFEAEKKPERARRDGDAKDASRSEGSSRKSTASESQVKQAQQRVKSLAREGEVVFALAVMALFFLIFVIGRIYWRERYYTPEEGLGYYLGLVGGVLMLVAIAYSMVKRVRALRATKFMRHWLRLHIFLGIVGPYMILFHSTFHIGSLNGGIALVSMVLVFLSGVVGRYLYSRIYLNLDGTRAQAQEVRDVMQFFGRRIQSKRIERFQEAVLKEPNDLLHAFYKLLAFKVRSMMVWHGVLRDARKYVYVMGQRKGLSRAETREKYAAFKRDFREYMAALRKAALMGVYEKIFSFWRHAHVPLLYLLVISGIVHVIAVHMY